MQVPRSGSRMSRRGLIRSAGGGGLGLLSAALIGCTGGRRAPAGDGSSGARAPAASIPSAAEPKYGGVLRTTQAQEPGNLDVWINSSSIVGTWAAQPIYSQLVRWKTGPDIVPVSVLEGDVAKSWEAPDPKTWTFKLREDVKFHPKPPLNGRAVDSEDVKTSVERLLKIAPARQTLTDLVDRIETPDKSTITFRLKEAYPPFPEVLSGHLLLYIYSKEANVGQIDTQKIEGAIGSGPWMWKTKATGVAWEFERHPEWHIKDAAGRKLPYAAGWRQALIPEYAQTIAQFAAGQLSMFTPKTEDAEGLLARAPKSQVVPTRVSAGTTGFYFHQQTPTNVMRDVRLRRAWSMGIDRKGLLETFGQFELAKKLGYTLSGGVGNPPIGYGVEMEYWMLDPYGPKMGPSGKWFEYNVAEAKKLVQAAGYDGQRIGIKTPGTGHLSTLEPHIPMAKAVGFNAQIEVMDFDAYVAGPYLGKGPYQAAYGSIPGYPTVDEYCYNLMMPGGYRNMPAIDQNTPDAPKVFDLIRKQRNETNKEARREIVYEIQRLAADQMWFVPSMHGRWNGLDFGRPEVKGFGQYVGGSTTPPSTTYPYYWLDT